MRRRDLVAVVGLAMGLAPGVHADPALVAGVYLAPAEILVITPQGGGRFAIAGRLPVPAR